MVSTELLNWAEASSSDYSSVLSRDPSSEVFNEFIRFASWVAVWDIDCASVDSKLVSRPSIDSLFKDLEFSSTLTEAAASIVS